jgi:hypothetical protein
MQWNPQLLTCCHAAAVNKRPQTNGLSWLLLPNAGQHSNIYTVLSQKDSEWWQTAPSSTSLPQAISCNIQCT